MDTINSMFSNNVNTQRPKSLNVMFGLLIGTTILITIVLIYGFVKYFDYVNFKKNVCDQHKTLNNNIDIINENNELLSNKKKQFYGHLSKTHEDLECVGEWSNCDLDKCTKTYNVKMPKSGKGKDCDYSDGQKLQCSDGDSGDCKPNNCVGNWGECSDGTRTYTITNEGNTLGEQCPAANGAIDRTTCETLEKTEGEQTEEKTELEKTEGEQTEEKTELEKTKLEQTGEETEEQTDTTKLTFQNFVESILSIFFSKN